MNHSCLWITGILLLTMLSSCKKDLNEKQNISSASWDKKSASEKILKFTDSYEYLQNLKKVTAFSTAERKIWEESQNFISYGRACDEFYNSLKIDENWDDEAIRKVVLDNADYLQIIQDNEGDCFLETRMYQNLKRYLINVDKLYQIGETIYKVIGENITVRANIKCLEKLKTINESNYLSYLSDAEILICHPSFDSDVLKDAGNNCGTDHEARVTNGNDRTYMHIVIVTDDLDIGREQYTYFIVRPYKKTLGIWYWCTRTISCDISIRTDYYLYTNPNSGDWDDPEYGNYENSGTSDDHLSDILNQRMIATGFYPTTYSHFGGYDCWGDTPSTSPNVVLQCNTSVLQ